MKLNTLVVGPLEENCYIVYDENSKKALIVDPGAEAAHIIAMIEKESLQPQLIVNTHGHWDHVGAVAELKEKYGIPFYLHADDEEWLREPLCHLLGQGVAPELTVDHTIDDDTVLMLGDEPLRVIHTPGHTKGGCVLWLENADIAFTGDTLFKGTIGRTDFPGGSYEDILTSVQKKMAVLPDQCVVYPGHGPKSTMAWERAHNPYMRYQA
ncbi:MAG: MBL fold metallo-hydrolase [Peptococcaceae bacterium]|nr:MBL fold metallo-hydrolase [Peptococcaceae bacterium]